MPSLPTGLDRSSSSSVKKKKSNMGLLDFALNLFLPPASMIMVAFAWPSLVFIHACEWMYRCYTSENMDDKVVIVTGASSGIGEHIAYEYAKRRANLVLVARRESRLRGIRERAREMGARNVLVVGADVVKEEDCRRVVEAALARFGRVNHLVNAASLGHKFFFEDTTDTSVFPHLMDINFWGNVFPTYVALPHLRRSNGRIVVNASVENWLPMPRMSLYAASKAAVTSFYETLRHELNDEVGITISTHSAVGGEMTRGKFLLEEGAEMQWKEEREVAVTGRHAQEYAKQIVSGACRGDSYVKPAKWHSIFLLYKVFVPEVLRWTFKLLLLDGAQARTPPTPLPLPGLEPTSPRKPLMPVPVASSPRGSPLTER